MIHEEGNIEFIRVLEDGEFDWVYRIRREVFVEEQGVPEEEEMDGHEHISHHYLAILGGQPVGCARWRVTPARLVKLERFAVLKPYRGKGIGEALVRRVLKDLPPGFEVYLHAQIEAVPLYKKCGFVEEGEIFDECGILHRKMILK